ncbi:MarR family transcriptional regulator, partial [Nocardia abscessus]
MSELAVQTALSTSGVTRLVDRLARAGLVERELDTADRRSAYA